MKKDILQLFGEDAEISSEAVATEASEAEVSPEEEFEALIKGKYAQAFRNRTQNIIDKRFSKMKSYEKAAKAAAPLFEDLSVRFPHIDKSDHAALVSAYLSETQNTSDSAQEVKNEETDPVLAERARDTASTMAAQRLSEYLFRESEKLREIYPSFDLTRELDENPELRQLLSAGVSLRRAFETVNLEKIMGQSLRYAAKKAARSTADSLKGAQRVSENPINDRASSAVRTDVNNLTERDIHRILSQVSRGAKITF